MPSKITGPKAHPLPYLDLQGTHQQLPSLKTKKEKLTVYLPVFLTTRIWKAQPGFLGGLLQRLGAGRATVLHREAGTS